MITDPKIEAYVGQVRVHLSSANAGEEEQVVGEVSSRIQKLAGMPGATPESVLEQLGSARTLAHQYRDALLIVKAGKSVSPVVLLQASLRNGILGILAFLVGMAAYWLGGIFIIFGALALAWSAIRYASGTGPAIGSGMFQSAATVMAGAAILAGTSFVLRALLRVSERARLPR